MGPRPNRSKKQNTGKPKVKSSEPGKFKAKYRNNKGNVKNTSRKFQRKSFPKTETKKNSPSTEAASPGAQKLQKTDQSKSRKSKDITEKDTASKQRVKHEKKNGIVGRMMAIYESLRRSDVSKREKVELIEEVLSITDGKQSEVAFKHNSVRVLEMCVKYGTKEQRAKIWDKYLELLEEIIKSKYGRFLVQKMLKYGNSEQRNSLIKKLKGKVIKLLKHKDAGRTLEGVYSQYANVKMKANMVEEFYGPEFHILKASFGSDLAEIFKSAPERKRFVMSFLKDTLENLASKEAVTYSIYHRAATEYLKNAEKVAQDAFLEVMKEKVVNILHTEDGAKIAMQCIWSSSAKDRKKITKSFKTYIPKICKEPYGHTVLMALFDVIDDTVLIEKSVFTELISNLDELIVDQYGRRVILYVLAPRDTKYFSPPLVQLLEQGDQNPTSKKPKNLRIPELRQHILPTLIAHLKTRIPQAMRDKQLCHILIEVLKNISDCDNCCEVFQSIASAVAENFDPDENNQEHVISHPIGHWVLTRLLAQDKDRANQGYSNLLASAIIKTIPGDQMDQWIQMNRGAFIIARLVESCVDDVTQHIRQFLQVTVDSMDSSSSKGIEALKKALTNEK